MATWINNGHATMQGGSEGPTWINNAPPAQNQYIANYDYQTPQSQIDYWMGQYAPRYSQPQYDQPSVGAFVQPSNQYRGIYNGGAGGVTGGANINWMDASNALVPLYRQKLEAAEQAWRVGQIQNPNEMQSLRDSLSRWENIQANGGTTPQMFALPQYSLDNFFSEANEASRLPGQGGTVRPWAVDANLAYGLRGQNQGQLMRPWTATGLVESNFGGSGGGGFAGFDLPAGLREASFTTSNGQPIISTGPGGVITQYAPNEMGGWTSMGNLNGANATPYNNGDLRSAHDFGSYLNPLLRSGMTDGYAIASNHPRSFFGSGGQDFTPFPPTSRDSNGHSDWMEGTAMPGDGSRDWTRMSDGSYASWGADGSLTIQRPNGSREVIDSTPLPESNNPFPFDMSGSSSKFGGATDQFAMPLFNDLADLTLPPQVEAMLGNLARGYEVIDNANPANLLPKNAMINYLKDAAINFATDRKTWRGDGAHFSTIQNILSQPWGNRSAAPMMYPSMAALFL